MIVIVYSCLCSLFSGVKVALGEGKQCHKKISRANLPITCCSMEMLLSSPALTCPLPQLKNTLQSHTLQRMEKGSAMKLPFSCT